MSKKIVLPRIPHIDLRKKNCWDPSRSTLLLFKQTYPVLSCHVSKDYLRTHARGALHVISVLLHSSQLQPLICLFWIIFVLRTHQKLSQPGCRFPSVACPDRNLQSSVQTNVYEFSHLVSINQNQVALIPFKCCTCVGNLPTVAISYKEEFPVVVLVLQGHSVDCVCPIERN